MIFVGVVKIICDTSDRYFHDFLRARVRESYGKTCHVCHKRSSYPNEYGTSRHFQPATPHNVTTGKGAESRTLGTEQTDHSATDPGYADRLLAFAAEHNWIVHPDQTRTCTSFLRAPRHRCKPDCYGMVGIERFHHVLDNLVVLYRPRPAQYALLAQTDPGTVDPVGRAERLGPAPYGHGTVALLYVGVALPPRPTRPRTEPMPPPRVWPKCRECAAPVYQRSGRTRCGRCLHRDAERTAE